MITVHHLNNSRSQRILWMLEELGVPYEIQHYERDPETMLAPASLKKVHPPLGKSPPIITDGDLVVAESGAIIEYLAHTYGKDTMLPEAGGQQWLDYTYWMHYAEGSLMPPLVMRLVFEKVKTSQCRSLSTDRQRNFGQNQPDFYRPDDQDPPGLRGVTTGQKHLVSWGGTAECGGYSDELSSGASVARGGIVGNDRPNIKAWVARVHARPPRTREHWRKVETTTSPDQAVVPALA